MPELWLRLNDIPAEGREFTFEDQALWTEPWAEYKLPYSPGRPIHADVLVLPQKDGCLVRGRIEGSVMLSCDRCAEEIEHEFSEPFDVFEPYDPGEDGVTGFARRRGEVIELDAAGLLWEQFLLAMPVKPLCMPDCRGLCPGCGQNLNVTACACPDDEADPRLATLRGLKLNKH